MPSDNTNKEGSTSAASTTIPTSSSTSTQTEAPPSTLEATPLQRNAMEEFIASPENPDRWRDLVQSMGRRGHRHQNDSADEARPSAVDNTDGDQDQFPGQMNITSDESVDAPRAQPVLDNHITDESVDALQPVLELIGEDNCDLPVPAGITEAILDAAEAEDGSIVKQTGHMEQITDRDGPADSSAVALAASLEATDRAAKQHIGPSASSAVALAASLEATDEAAKERIKHQLETVNDDERPVPFDSSQFEDSAGEMAKKLPATPSHTGDEGESIVYPRRSEIEDEVELVYINTPRGEGGDEESPPVDNEAGIGNNGTTNIREDDSSQVIDATANIRQSTDQGMPSIHAYRVEEGDVVIATPTLPWCKQRRVRFFLGTVFFVLAAMAIALGVAFSSGTDSDTTNNATVIVQSSTPPSSSLSPSSSPTYCGDILVSERQTIDLGLGDPLDLSMAVDGSNMVLTVRDGWDSSTLHIMFYSLANDVWARSSRFEQDHDGYARVAISGKTAFVGLPNWGDNNEGIVLVYAQDEFGFWKEIEDPFTLDTEFSTVRFGRHADISGDLACVEDSDDNTYLFHRDGDTKWIQFDMIANAWECSVDGDTVAIQEFDENYDGNIQLYTYISVGIVPLQYPIKILDSIGVKSVHLNGNNLIIAEGDDSVNNHISIYHRDEVNGTFSFLQQFKIPITLSGYRLGYVSIDKDLMVAWAEDEPIHIFSERNGYWVETLVLDRIYGSYTLSDRNLLAWGHRYNGYNEIHYYNLDRCTQAWPTQTPSLSLMPSSSPTKTPSASPSTSLSPSASTSPTGSYCIIVTIVYGDYSIWTSWELQSIGLDSNGVVVQLYEEDNIDATSHTETVCLTEGEYEFFVYDGGLCRYCEQGHYNVTTLDGQLIAEGGEFGQIEATRFSIPFEIAPSVS